MSVKYKIKPYKAYRNEPPNDFGSLLTDTEIEMALRMSKVGKKISLGAAYFLRLKMCAENYLGKDENGTEIYDFSSINLPISVWAAQQGYYIEIGEDELDF